jgi:hypothetical protein
MIVAGMDVLLRRGRVVWRSRALAHFARKNIWALVLLKMRRSGFARHRAIFRSIVKHPNENRYENRSWAVIARSETTKQSTLLPNGLLR